MIGVDPPLSRAEKALSAAILLAIAALAYLTTALLQGGL